MHFIWKRYSRSGYAPPLFYVAIALGFAALAVWALVQTNWIVAALAIAMVPVTIAGSRVMQRLSAAEAASRADAVAAATSKDDEHA